MKNQKYPEMGGLYQIVEKQKKKWHVKLRLQRLLLSMEITACNFLQEQIEKF